MSSAEGLTDEVTRITTRKTLGDPGIAPTLLRTLLTTFNATGGRIYFLNLRNAHYESVASDDRSGHRASVNARRLRSVNAHGWGMLELAIMGGAPQIANDASTWVSSDRQVHRYGSRVVFPILRQRTVVGLVDLHAQQEGAFRGWGVGAEDRFELAIQQLGHAYEAQAVRSILAETAQFRVSLNQPEAVTMSNLIRFVANSSGMQYIALRKLEADGTLRCVRTHGFGSTAADDSLDLYDLENQHKPFAQVVNTRTHWIADSLKGDDYSALREISALKDVRSFVACPVLAGDTLWGVVSFASAVQYEYSELEVYALRALANLTGAALDTIERAQYVAESLFDEGRLMQAVLSNEVVVATRHEMYDQLEIVGNARTALVEVLQALGDPQHGSRLTRKDIDLLTFEARSLDDAHGQMNKVLETIRFSQSELRPEKRRVRLAEVWERALEPFTYRINRASVARVVNEVSPSIAINGSYDWLRIVFMHLILNSLDAFDRGLTKGRREIALMLRARQGGRVSLRYIDNAGGILPGTLTRRGIALESPQPSAIFERYVTSKAKGTGLGLASCRAALATMDGSIELVDSRRGITFDLELDEYENPKA